MNRRILKAYALVVLVASAGSARTAQAAGEGDPNAAKAAVGAAAGVRPVLWWSFDEKGAGTVKDAAGSAADAIDGNYTYIPGPCGSAIKADGYTTCIERRGARAPKLDQAMTACAWVVPAAYPWNWCPVIASQTAEGWGFALAVGPHGDFSFEISIEGRRQKCLSDKFVLPLRRWTHIAATYDPNAGIALYVNGKPAGRLEVKGRPDWYRQGPGPIRGLMNYEKAKPSNLYREHGTLASWFSVDGAVDEVKLYDAALSAERIRADATPANKDAVAGTVLPRRRMPAGPAGPGRFGAYYCNLKYYPEWDNLWSVDKDTDVVVRFDQSATRVVFWRGSRYSPAWVSENGLWMADQSVEAWNDEQGCFEHMQDPQCRYSSVRVIESSDARVVVHWRYALTSAYYEIWNVNPKTNRGCWVDEYYTIYPDQFGVRKPTWKTGTLGRPHQFQESLPFTDSEQTIGEVVEKDFATIANFQGQTLTMTFTEKPEKNRPVPANTLVQRYNFRSKNRPSIVFEPGDRMHHTDDEPMPRLGMNSHGACAHWPVCQANCDGRRAQSADRPTHFLGFPISYPPLHEKDGRTWWNGLYGMTEMDMPELIFVGKSWAQAPKLGLKSADFAGGEYDLAQRAYTLARAAGAPAGTGTLSLTLEATEDSPVFNPAFVIAGWSPDPARLKLTLGGRAVPRGDAFRIGTRHGIDGDDTIIFLRAKTTEPLTVELSENGD